MNGLMLSMLSVVFLCAGLARGAEQILRDIAYDDEHDAQIIDVYRVTSEKPAPAMVFIHGGGWRAGSKKRVPGFLRKAHAEGWLAVVSVEYRFTDVAVHPAQVDDCARAIQFVRQNAGEWNIDPNRIGVTGGSAGGHLAAYMALQVDEASPVSEDPVERQSSRVLFAIPFAGPTDWGLLSRLEHRHPAYRQLIGYEPGTPAGEMAADRIRDVSPLSFVSADDPPILIVHGDADQVVPIEHAQVLEAALKKVGVPVELHVVKGGKHGVAGAGGKAGVRADAYMRERLSAPRPPGPPTP
ncbi:MAG: alpha/beta hydrolase [Lentisphaerae bacterium]|nr:alpha/beta hydrolase [Lentisphaerota bacterium]MBT4815121.1 alpha/beta hydrolase [Lentisphaerota bacterium]MBT5613106.1 alpha/beta hydrolase [Lentisphaerota bacterium]MBT7056422.1 alpha/beta hydrolase [Lentisphaerota bacterium]MBT7844451.1 alpha/beta hydrolase [Lentisphaerota bacterium]